MSEKRQLSDIRKELDHIDHNLLEALALRQKLIQETAHLKRDKHAVLRDPSREHEILSRIGRVAQEQGVDKYFAMNLFRQIIDYSVRFQTDFLMDHHNLRDAVSLLRVGYQGTDGAYSQRAVHTHFSSRRNELLSIGHETFRDVVEAVDSGALHYGVLPIENTTAGSINDTYDLLHKHDLHVVGEEVVRVQHCLVTISEVPVSNIKRIYSHPQAIAQCSEFLSKLHHCKVEAYLDTAMAAKKVLEDDDLSQAAIASRDAAELYGLHIVSDLIGNQKENFTRFVVVAKDPVVCDGQIRTKTSIIMSAAHRKGALAQALNILHQYDLNLTKLESRPSPGNPWEYLFYIDFEGNLASPAAAEALEKLREHSGFIKVLGTYPARIS